MNFGPITSSSPGQSQAAAELGTPVSSLQSMSGHDKELIKAVKALDSTDLFGHESELTFIFDRQSHRALVRVVNRQTREVIMQIPPEYVIRMAEQGQDRVGSA